MNCANPRKILFVSTMDSVSWGGSEVLWSETALKLRQFGHEVSASVSRWRPRPSQHETLLQAGVRLNERWFPTSQPRPRVIFNPLVRRASPVFFTRWLKRQQPDLICCSHGSVGEDLTLIRICAQSGIPYCIVLHANAEYMWPGGQRARELADFYGRAKRVFFVSEGNRTLLETQTGFEFKNAEVVRNPFNVRRNAAPPWPTELNPVRLACVGRLEPGAKGQDLLLRALARDTWRSRPVAVSFFGKGWCEDNLRQLVRLLKMDGRVTFNGHVSDIESIWATHHALILPSRFEGLPLAIVEAMHCARPVIVTDVAGNAEIVQDGVTGFIAEAPTERHLHAALERAWEQRYNWEAMGKAAAQAIRELLPADPAAVFAQKLLAVSAESVSA
jgi:glycosyltransferase involved in cell wall biosynthesis